MSLNTDHLDKCIKTLESSLTHLKSSAENSIDYDVFRNAAVKGFELCLETSGKLLRKVLKSYVGNPRAIDALTYKDAFRQAALHGLIMEDVVRRWFAYRDNRNDTAHDYGAFFAETTLKLLPEFLNDVKQLKDVLDEQFKKSQTAP